MILYNLLQMRDDYLLLQLEMIDIILIFYQTDFSQQHLNLQIIQIQIYPLHEHIFLDDIYLHELQILYQLQLPIIKTIKQVFQITELKQLIFELLENLYIHQFYEQ